MASVKYALRVLTGVRFKKMKECVVRCHEMSGKSGLFLALDMGVCALRYGAGYYDYMMYGFFDRTAAERDTYLTRFRNKKLISYMNDDAYGNRIDNKNEFNARFAKYLHREILDGRTCTEVEFAAFMADKDTCFAKPELGDSGRGVEKLKKADYASTDEMLAYIRSKGNCAIEQCLVQHKEMSRLYPTAVNCMRVVTDLVDGEVHIAYVVLKCGNGGSVCDNSGQGGLICAVDKQTGTVCSIATDDLIAHHYEVHPETGVRFEGFQIPMFAEAMAMCREAALLVPQIRHTGWDVAITPEGPAFIEGNNYPGTDLCQLYWNTPERCGLMPFYRELLPELKF